MRCHNGTDSDGKSVPGPCRTPAEIDALMWDGTITLMLEQNDLTPQACSHMCPGCNPIRRFTLIRPHATALPPHRVTVAYHLGSQPLWLQPLLSQPLLHAAAGVLSHQVTHPAQEAVPRPRARYVRLTLHGAFRHDPAARLLRPVRPQLQAEPPHAREIPLLAARPGLAPCASSWRSWRLWAARHSHGERPGHWAPSHCLGWLELAASKVADSAASDHARHFLILDHTDASYTDYRPVKVSKQVRVSTTTTLLATKCHGYLLWLLTTALLTMALYDG